MPRNWTPPTPADVPAPLRDLATRHKMLEIYREAFNRDVEALAARLRAGEIDVATWERLMRGKILENHRASLIIGKGGSPGALTFSDYGRLGGRLKRQYAYLRGFANHILSKAQSASQGLGGLPSEKYIAWRAKLYGRGPGKATMYDSFAVGLLEQRPGDGKTKCLVNCACQLRFEQGNDPNTVHVYWDMGPVGTEHCEDCLELNRRWNPYVLHLPVGMAEDWFGVAGWAFHMGSGPHPSGSPQQVHAGSAAIYEDRSDLKRGAPREGTVPSFWGKTWGEWPIADLPDVALPAGKQWAYDEDAGELVVIRKSGKGKLWYGGHASTQPPARTEPPPPPPKPAPAKVEPQPKPPSPEPKPPSSGVYADRTDMKMGGVAEGRIWAFYTKSNGKTGWRSIERHDLPPESELPLGKQWAWDIDADQLVTIAHGKEYDGTLKGLWYAPKRFGIKKPEEYTIGDKTYSKIKSTERGMRERKRGEDMYIFDGDGNVIYETSSRSNSVTITSQAAKLMKNNICTHSHPAKTRHDGNSVISHSLADISVMMNLDMLESRVVGWINGIQIVCRIRRPTAGWTDDWKRKVRDAISKQLGREDRMVDSLRGKGLTKSEYLKRMRDWKQADFLEWVSGLGIEVEIAPL